MSAPRNWRRRPRDGQPGTQSGHAGDFTAETRRYNTELLLRDDKELKVLNNEGRTPSHEACKKSVAPYLVRRGADTTTVGPGPGRKCPLDWCDDAELRQELEGAIGEEAEVLTSGWDIASDQPLDESSTICS